MPSIFLLKVNVLETLTSVACYVLLKQLNLDRLLSKMWDEMGLVRVYTKPQGQQADFDDPAVLSTVCCMRFFSIIIVSTIDS